MPVRVVKRGTRYAIVETATGEVKGTSASKRDAQASARIRNEAHRSKLRSARRAPRPRR